MNALHSTYLPALSIRVCTLLHFPYIFIPISIYIQPPSACTHMAVKRALSMDPDGGPNKRPRGANLLRFTGGKRKRDTGDESEVLSEFDLKRLAISPLGRDHSDAEKTTDDYTYENRRLRELHFLREQRKLEARAAQLRIGQVGQVVQVPLSRVSRVLHAQHQSQGGVPQGPHVARQSSLSPPPHESQEPHN